MYVLISLKKIIADKQTQELGNSETVLTTCYFYMRTIFNMAAINLHFAAIFYPLVQLY